MFSHYLKIAFRSLVRHKLYTAINLIGLTVAVSSVLIVVIFVRHELSYDSHFSKADRIYRMGSNVEVNDGSNFSIAGTFMPLGPALKQDFPEIEHAVRLLPSGGTFRVGESLYQDLFYWADANVFDVFDADVLYGDLETALSRPNSFVLTESLAMKYFGTVDVVGQTMTFDQDRIVEVAAVIKAWPRNTHLITPMFGSMETARDVMGEASFNSWRNIGINRTYILLKTGVSAQAVESGLPDFLSRWSQSETPNKNWLDMQRLTDVYLAPRRADDFPPKGNQARVAIAVFVALLLFLVAVFNFNILTLALAQGRYVEMGLRKVHGAKLRDVFIQVVGESCLMMGLAYGVAVFAVELALPLVATWLDAGLLLSASSLPIPIQDLNTAFPQSILDNRGLILVGLVAALGLGVVSGFIPALIIARAGSSGLLNQSRTVLSARSRIGFVMVLTQFAAAISLVIIGATVSAQIQHLRKADLGFNKDNLLIIGESGQSRSVEIHGILRSVLQGIPGVVSVSRSNHAPTIGASRSGYEWQDQIGDNAIIAWETGVDENYVATMGMEVVAGTDFLPGMTQTTERDEDGNILSRETFALITEPFLKKLGATDPEQVLGTALRYAGNPNNVRRRIIGIVKPVEFNSGFRESETDVFFLKPNAQWSDTTVWHGKSSKLIVRLNGTNIPETLNAIDAAWSEVEPDFPLRRWFLDERFEILYLQSERQSDLFRVGITVAVVISAMGLFGLAAFSGQRRTKEVGVRKSNGATTSQLVRFMAWDLTKPVLYANVVAWPMAYIAVSGWLESFVLRVNVSLTPFLMATMAGFLIAWLAVFLHVFRVAQTHPAEALRYE